MFNTLIEGAAYQGNVTASIANATAIFNQFNSTTFSSTAELFIEAPYKLILNKFFIKK